MNQITRMFLSIGAALLVYSVYWFWLSRICRVRYTPWPRAFSELRIRAGRSGYLRLSVGWAIAFLVYAFSIEDSGVPLTWYWLQECLLGGDWIGVVIASQILTFGEWIRATNRLPKTRATAVES